MKSTRVSPTHTIDTFETTKLMSTYLIAFIVHDFNFVESYTKSGLRVRIISSSELWYLLVIKESIIVLYYIILYNISLILLNIESSNNILYFVKYYP